MKTLITIILSLAAGVLCNAETKMYVQKCAAYQEKPGAVIVPECYIVDIFNGSDEGSKRVTIPVAEYASSGIEAIATDAGNGTKEKRFCITLNSDGTKKEVIGCKENAVIKDEDLSKLSIKSEVTFKQKEEAKAQPVVIDDPTTEESES